jgi:hypothetical protein
MTWPNFDLDLWPWPLSFGMMFTSPQTFICADDDDPEKENKKVEFFGKIQFLCYFVTKWRHNVKSLVDLKSTPQGLSYEVLHDNTRYGTVYLKILPRFSRISFLSETHEGEKWST